MDLDVLERPPSKAKKKPRNKRYQVKEEEAKEDAPGPFQGDGLDHMRRKPGWWQYATMAELEDLTPKERFRLAFNYSRRRYRPRPVGVPGRPKIKP